MLAVTLARLFRRERKERSRAAELEAIAGALEEQNRTSERSFLAAGGRLTEFLEVLRRAREGTASMAASLSGERVEATAAALQSVLGLSTAMEQRVVARAALSRTTATAARELRVPVDGFASAVRVFRVLGTLIRIESSRLPDTESGLQSLAGDVAELTAELDRRTEAMLEKCAALRRQAEASLEETQRAGSRQQRQLPELVQTAMVGVTALQARRAQAQEFSARALERYAQASAALNEIVAGLQFHDITRQQVEHVATALRQQQDALEESQGSAVVALQAAQLGAAADLFTQSVEGLCRNLRTLAGDVKEMSRQTRGLCEERDTGHGSLFLQLEQAFSAVLESLEDCRGLDAAVPDVGAAVGEFAAQIGSLTKEIEGMGLRMQRIALNTSIRAVHVGTLGEPLERLGGAIQELCSGALAGSSRVAGVLESLEAAPRTLAAETLETEALAEEAALRASVARLRVSQESGQAKSEEAAREADDLAGAVERLVEDLEQHFPVVLTECAEKLRQLAAEEGAAVPGADQARLSELSRLYTMESERAIHNGIGADAVEPVAAGGAEFGDNVELF